MASTDSRAFYVYILLRPDGTVCYVGKGKGRRWKQSAAGQGNNKRVASIVKMSGNKCLPAFVDTDLTEDQAFALEKELIAYFGRGCDGGTLVNIGEGGEGVHGPKSDEHRAKIRKNHWNGKSHPEVAASIGAALKNRPKGSEARMAMSVSAKNRDRSAGYSAEHAAAIRAGVSRYWQKRRELGLPLTNRSEAGHRKHSETMRARYARQCQQTKEM